MNHPPAVVAVDDTPHELDAIVKALRQLDVACLPIQITGIDPDISGPLSDVRLIFFDINYMPGTTTQTQRFETAATVLERVIAKDNGPYMLVTWTSKAPEHDDFMVFLAQNVPEIPAPAITACLAKERFVTAGALAGTGVEDGASLQDEISLLLQRELQINALLQWERSARRAAGEVVASILGLFTREQQFSNDCGAQIEGLLTHMATCAVGPDQFVADQRAAINEAFAPILFDRMTHAPVTIGNGHLWKQALNVEKNNLVEPDITQKRRLNTLSHIAMLTSGPMNAGDRGVVFELSPSTGQYVAFKAGTSVESIASEFVFVVNEKGDRVDGVTTSDLEPVSRWVMIGLRAVCDQAHNRGTLRPVVVGLEIPATALVKGRPGLRLREHGAMYTTPVFEAEAGAGMLSGGRVIIVNWHWTTSLGAAELAGANVLYRLREAAMNAMGSGMSSYSSRPGIINFSEPFHWK